MPKNNADFPVPAGKTSSLPIPGGKGQLGLSSINEILGSGNIAGVVEKMVDAKRSIEEQKGMTERAAMGLEEARIKARETAGREAEETARARMGVEISKIGAYQAMHAESEQTERERVKADARIKEAQMQAEIEGKRIDAQSENALLEHKIRCAELAAERERNLMQHEKDMLEINRHWDEAKAKREHQEHMDREENRRRNLEAFGYVPDELPPRSQPLAAEGAHSEASKGSRSVISAIVDSIKGIGK